MRQIIIFIFALIVSTFIYQSLIPIFSQQGKIDPALLTGKYDYSSTEAVFNNKRLLIPQYLVQQQEENLFVLGDTSKPKRIEIDLTNQRLYAYEGSSKVFNFLISSGKWGLTPTGRFWVWIKLPSTLMKGGSKVLGTYYYLPNVPYTMFFFNDKIPKYIGYGIHGAYWHDNFGHPMSHGCINMKPEEAKLLYQWANPQQSNNTVVLAAPDNPGTEIIIYGQTPKG